MIWFSKYKVHKYVFKVVQGLTLPVMPPMYICPIFFQITLIDVSHVTKVHKFVGYTVKKLLLLLMLG